MKISDGFDGFQSDFSENTGNSFSVFSNQAFQACNKPLLLESLAPQPLSPFYGLHDIRRLISMVSGRPVYIQTHNFPDADALASALGLKYILTHFGINVTMCCSGIMEAPGLQNMLKLLNIKLTPINRESNIPENAFFVYVDCQKRNGNLTPLAANRTYAAIDHHPLFNDEKESDDYAFRELFVTGSCSSIITWHLKELGLIPDKRVATALLYGLKTDTGNFTRGVTEFDIDMYRLLFRIADKDILKVLDHTMLSVSDIESWSQAVRNIKVKNETAFTYLGNPCPDAVVSGLSDFMLSFEGISFVLVFSPRNYPEKGIRITARSLKKGLHLGRLLSSTLQSLGGNGGGHSYMAAGFLPGRTLEGDASEICERLVVILLNGL